ncbi:MAG: hypothetical protein GX925_03865 [Clostridiales bacterium]|nr:hypothetical protein [Clostridiales bacterium]
MYFNKTGSTNSISTVNIALEAAKTREINNIVIASNTGESAMLLAGEEQINRVWVTLAYGYSKPGKNHFNKEMLNRAKNCGIKVLTTTHILSGAERGISTLFGGAYPVEIIANTLRMFGQGVKVCVEISAMALDAGLIPYGVPIIAIAGTDKGVDTSIVITPAHANKIFDTKIHEILCKPLLKC